MSTSGANAGVVEGYKPRFVDIGINLTDPVYSGSYHGTQRHPSDLSAVLSRAKEAGCRKLIITGSDIPESEKAIELCKEHPNFLYCTVGVHPCTSASFDTHPAGPSALLQSLKTLALSAFTPSSPIVAFGEIGLDYDRLSHAPASTQLKYFRLQLDLLTSLPMKQRLPLFLHSRAAAVDFAAELRSRLDLLPKRGVVHSFTGTVDEMTELVDMGFDIGINGCSLKTIENCDVVRAVPLSHIQIETDGPWCEMRAAHASSHYISRDYKPKNKQGETVERISDEDEGIAKDILETEAQWKWVKKEKWVQGGLVKGRNESCMIGRVVVAVARIKGCSVKEVADAALENSVRMFGLE